jgi:hypothetical protein
MSIGSPIFKAAKLKMASPMSKSAQATLTTLRVVPHFLGIELSESAIINLIYYFIVFKLADLARFAFKFLAPNLILIKKREARSPYIPKYKIFDLKLKDVSEITIVPDLNFCS